MKKRSIRFKFTLMLSLILIIVSGVAFFITYKAGDVVLRNTVKGYLIGAVEENADKISYVSGKAGVENHSYIEYGDGYLEIDLNFMDVMNDVYTALYISDGTMLYGEDPLSSKMEKKGFTESYIWDLKAGDTKYMGYDRKLPILLPDGKSLWIRGIVPETKNTKQLSDIARLSLTLLPILIVISIVISYLITSRLLSGLRRIENAADTISRGDDLKSRIEADDRYDEVGNLARAFNRMLDRLERSFESERQFTSDASHELRTPTSVILAQSEYTLEKERSAQEYEEALGVILRQGQRMELLINDMLDYSRMDQKPERYPFEELDLSGIVSETAGQLALLKTNGISLTMKVEEGCRIWGNKLLISRLLQNLIGNAYRYGKENGSIEVALLSRKNRLILSVSDDGAGIAKEEQEKIFDRFYRGDASRSIQGTGLGLSMVKKIAQLHEAEIELESEPGRGSIFRIIFKKSFGD